MKRLRLVLALLPLALAACAMRASKPTPAPLTPLQPTLQVRQAWMLKLPSFDFPLKAQVHGERLTLAAGDGTVLQIDAGSGRELWRQTAGAPLAAGVGSDGQQVAVVTRRNELVVMQDGKVQWRQRLSAQAFTAPLVAGARVFVVTADRAVTAYDGASGARLWTQQRPGNDPLVLRQSGVLLAVGDTLVVGQSGRLAGLNPLTGSLRWEAPVAIPRGVNEIERLVDLVDPPGRLANVVCVRAFQAAVGCVNADSGSPLWSRPADGQTGLATDGGLLYGSESNGQVQAWRRSNGERAWVNEELRLRGLSAPALIGSSVVVGDFQGQIHFLSRDDGSLQARVATDGSAVAATPVLAGRTLVVLTRAGGVYGLQLP